MHIIILVSIDTEIVTIQLNTGQINNEVNNITYRKNNVVKRPSFHRTPAPIPQARRYSSYLHHIKCATATSQEACEARPSLHSDAVNLTSVLCAVMNVQVVKLSLKRTVWGVVMSATASSCPSDKPSSAAEEKKTYDTYVIVNVSR